MCLEAAEKAKKSPNKLPQHTSAPLSESTPYRALMKCSKCPKRQQCLATKKKNAQPCMHAVMTGHSRVSKKKKGNVCITETWQHLSAMNKSRQCDMHASFKKKKKKRWTARWREDRKPTRASAASHPNYTAATKGLKLNNNYLNLMVSLLGFLFLLVSNGESLSAFQTVVYCAVHEVAHSHGGDRKAPQKEIFSRRRR